MNAHILSTPGSREYIPGASKGWQRLDVDTGTCVHELHEGDEHAYRSRSLKTRILVLNTLMAMDRLSGVEAW